MTVRIIGLHGKARSGKDTTFEFIREWAEEQGHSVQRDAFADRLKISAARALGFDKNEIETMNALKEKGGQVLTRIPLDGGGFATKSVHISGREYLQRYGTEAHRNVFGQDFWISQVLDRDRPGIDILVVTDVRFENEGEAIQDRGGEIWHLVRPGSGAGNHASEQPISESLIDMTINNNGSLEGLRANVMSVLDVGAVLR